MPQKMRHAQLFQLLNDTRVDEDADYAAMAPRPRIGREVSEQEAREFLGMAAQSWNPPRI